MIQRGARPRSARRPKRIEELLKSEAKRWGVVKGELERARRSSTATSAAPRSAARRRARVRSPTPTSSTRTPTWSSRATAGSSACASSRTLDSTRTREGDEVLAVLAGQHQAQRRLLLQLRRRPTSCRIVDVPPSTGYGDPVQKLFKFDDGERVVAALLARLRACEPTPSESCVGGHRSSGYGLRFALGRTSRSRPARAASSRASARATRSSACGPRRRRHALRWRPSTGHALVLSSSARSTVLANPAPARASTVIKLDGDDDRRGRLRASTSDARGREREGQDRRRRGAQEASRRRAAARARDRGRARSRRQGDRRRRCGADARRRRRQGRAIQPDG